MKTSEHLTENQLSAYLGDSALRPEAKHEIGRHLLQCDFCLKRLPQPTSEQFWAALMTDEVEDSQDEKTTLAARLESIVEALKQPKIFALGASALAIVLFFSAFVWLNSVKSSEMEIEVAENFETKEPQPVFNQTGDEKINFPSVPPSLENNNLSATVSTRNVADRDSPASKEIKPKQNSKITNPTGFNAKTQEKLPEKENIALTRGGAVPTKCSGLSAIDLAIEMSNETVILKWKKIPNAAKYHLYVSDDAEILIDEYETEQGISYALKKPLAPQKIYQWKVVVTLEDGKTIVGDSQKFTIKDLQSNQKKSDRREKSLIRCSESKLNR